MAFQLTKGNTTFDFDLAGGVTSAGNAYGKWKTSADQFSRIVVTKPDGTQDSLDVIWKFEENQLCLYQKDTKIFNFHTGQDQPDFNVTDHAVLVVTPVLGKPYVFEIRGEWDLTSDFDLAVTINGVTSAIDGYIENSTSLFEYWFSDGSELYSLTFTGHWGGTADTSENAADGSTIIHFNFARETGPEDQFSFPKSATFDKTINQFVYKFEKDGGNTKCDLHLVGLINIGKDSSITYSIGVQKQSGATRTIASTINIAAKMVTDTLTAAVSVKYAFTRADGKPSTNVLEISGQFTFDKATLQVVFKYSSVGAVRTIFFGGTLQLDSTGTKVVWAFTKQNNVTTLQIEISDVKFGVKSKLVLSSPNGGQKKSVTFILGVKI